MTNLMTQVGSKRRGKYDDFEGEEESSDGEEEIQSYLGMCS
jgi:hypothetical protein